MGHTKQIEAATNPATNSEFPTAKIPSPNEPVCGAAAQQFNSQSYLPLHVLVGMGIGGGHSGHLNGCALNVDTGNRYSEFFLFSS